MKTRLLKQLRREAQKRYSGAIWVEFAESIGMDYAQTREYIHSKKRIYILRRVAELKQKRK